MPSSTAEGPVQGVVRERNRIFYGVPYAAPPVGSLRWQPPQPALKHADVYNGTPSV
jgi:carboxylesterase type B